MIELMMVMGNSHDKGKSQMSNWYSTLVNTNFEIHDWGLIPYQQALDKQLVLVDEVALSRAENRNPKDHLVFCTHPPVVTKGRSTKPDDIFAWSGEVVEVQRGGRATYHGPSQIVVYPILNMARSRAGRPSQDVVGLLRAMETSIINVLSIFGINGQGRSLQLKPGQDLTAAETGVWVTTSFPGLPEPFELSVNKSHSLKIASLGIGVKKWVSFHGAAININRDPSAFVGLNPCGFESQIMTNLEDVLKNNNRDTTIDRDRFKFLLAQEMLQLL